MKHGQRIRGALVLAVAALASGAFSGSTAMADGPRKKILESAPPKCQPSIKYHAGDVWLKEFYEVPRGTRSTEAEVSYMFRVCWQRMLPEYISDPDPTCTGSNHKTSIPLATRLDLAIGIFHSSKTRPGRNAKAPLPITEFTMSLEEAEGGSGGPLCRSYTTSAVKRPKQAHAPWIRAQPDRPWDNEWSFQNVDTENDFRIGRADLTVTPGAFSAVKKGATHEVTQSFKACNAGADANQLVLGVNVGLAAGAKKTPAAWTSFVAVGTLKARRCKTVTHTFQTSVGMFRGFVKIDPKNTLKEASESNNVASFDYGAVEVSATTPRGDRPSKRKPKAKRSREDRDGPAKREPDDTPPEAPSEGEGGGGGQTDRGSKGDQAAFGR